MARASSVASTPRWRSGSRGSSGRCTALTSSRSSRCWPYPLVNWLSSNFLQLVLLPIIIVGQNVISAAQDGRAEADHETLTALHEMSKQQIEILEGQNKILDLLEKRAG